MISFLSCLQSKPTVLVLDKMERLLGYAATHDNAELIIRASDMLLTVFSDASFNSRPGSKSVAGGHHYLGRRSDPDFLNAPILNVCSTIPVVCAAVSEAEYGGVFGNCQAAVEIRSILHNLGYSQPPTLVLCDNECAIGLANESVRPKKSKSIDLRLDWVRDRVRQGQFIIDFVPGKANLADFLQNHCQSGCSNKCLPTLPPPLLVHEFTCIFF